MTEANTSDKRMLKTKKILLLGLNNSGKTSILLSLRKSVNILSFCSLKPTKKINVENIETQDFVLNIWDFGGQTQYRKRYLEEFESYIERVERIIYVIDVQDYKRFDIALEYLKEIIECIKEQMDEVDFSIFLHKYDPNLTEKEGFELIEDIINEKVVSKLPGIIPEKFKYELFKTSIYTVFEKKGF